MYPTVETERIILRPFVEDDAKNIFELVRAFDEQNNSRNFAHIRSIDDAKKLNDETITAGNGWMVLHKETQKPIGWVVCDKVGGADISKKLFIHGWTRTEYQHVGFCREILEKVLHFLFFGIKTATVLANAKNNEQAAFRLLSGCGFEIYNYVPKSKPHDDDTLVQFRISKEQYCKQDHVVAGTYDYEPPAKVKSPYSFAKPIRKISSISYIKEPTGYLCGQSVVAMLADVSVDEVISVMRTDKGTSTSMVRDALKYYGLKTATKARLRYTEGIVLPECCILSVKLPGYGHWSLYYKGRFYDPEFGVSDKLPEQARLRYYWEVITR